MLQRFARLFLIHFAIVAAGWLSLAGVGFVLALAFLADSSPSWREYLRNLLTVTAVLLYPLLFFAGVTGVTASIHLFFTRAHGSANGGSGDHRPRTTGQAATPAAAAAGAAQAEPGKERSAPPGLAGMAARIGEPRSSARPSAKGRHRPPLLRMLACAMLMIIGIAIIAANAPRTLRENGPVPTVLTSLVFFLPLVLAPSLWLWRTVRARREMPGAEPPKREA